MTLEELLGEGAPSAPSAQPQGLTLEDLLGEARPGKFDRFVTNAGARTSDIADFLESGWGALINPAPYVGRKVSEFLGTRGSEDEERARLREEMAALPQAQGFGEHAADFLGSVAPDVALGVGTAGVTSLAPTSLLAGEALQSAVLAPIEFGTRDPKSAALNTLIAPVAGTLIGKGINKIFGRGAKSAVAPTLEEVLDEPFVPRPAGVYQAPDLAALEAQDAADLAAKYGARPTSQTIQPFVDPPALRQSIAETQFREGSAPRMRLEEAEALAGYSPAPRPDLVQSIQQQGILDPIEIGVNPESGARMVFEGKHRIAAAREAGLSDIPFREVPMGPGLEGALRQEAMSAFRAQTQAKIMNAIANGRGVRTGDLMELGDPEIASAAHESFSNMLRTSAKVAGNNSELTRDIAETGSRLPPRINDEIEEVMDTLPPESAARFAQKLKGKGVCPI